MGWCATAGFCGSGRSRMRRVALVLVAACHGSEPSQGPADVQRVATVHRGDLYDRVVLTGELKAAASIELAVPRTDAWELPIRWMAEDGTVVKAGDRVLEFDNSSLMSNREQKHIAVLEAAMAFRLYQDVSVMDTADKDVTLRENLIAQDKAKLHADVAPDLLTARTAQEYQLATKKTAVDVAKSEKDLAAARAEANIEQRVKQIELEKAQRAVDTVERTIGELALKAPRDGTIVVGDHPWEGRKFQIGDTVQPGWPIVTLPDTTQPMLVRAELNGVDDGRVSVGMAGTCTLDAYPAKPLSCQVKDLTPVARAKNRKSLRRSFAVELTLDHADQERMRPGMSVKIELRRTPAQVLIVPRGAVVFADKGAHVRLAGGEVRDVKLGPCDAQGCAVESGLVEGDRVLLGGA